MTYYTDYSDDQTVGACPVEIAAPTAATRRSWVLPIFACLALSGAAFGAHSWSVNEAALGTTALTATAPISAPVRHVSLPSYNPQDLKAELPEWQSFKHRFVQPDGRVVDTGNGGVSHTEGQGWGMLLAVAFDDRATFDRIFDWTTQNMQRPNDALHAWRYDPANPRHVADTNNATDGDLFIAGALSRAARRWHDDRYAVAGDAIARSILTLLVRQVGDRTVLLPGAAGFERRDSVVVNLSYYAFPMFSELSALTPSPLWDKLRTDGLQLISEARFGRSQLPPDWLQISRANGALSAAPGWPARFSFDAIRVPLYLAWSNDLSAAQQRVFTNFWGASAQAPAWTDLQTGARSPYNAPSGMQAVIQLASVGGERPLARTPHVAEAQDYYSAALTLLARVAWHEAASDRTARAATGT